MHNYTESWVQRETGTSAPVLQSISGQTQPGQRQDKVNRPSLARQIAPNHLEHRCPVCRSIIYSRRHRLCGVCSRPLPEESLFTPSEARRIEKLIESERERHKRWLAGTLGRSLSLSR